MTMNVLVVRVFAAEDGRHGNELGVVLDAQGLDSALGPELTARLGFSETVFVDRVDEHGADVRIFNPTAEMKLAGHPLVGVSRVIADATGGQPRVLRPRLADPVDTWREGEITWIRANSAFAPDFEFVRHPTAAQVEALPVPPLDEKTHHQHWSWIDEQAGVLRARTFVGRMGIPEDEATGAAAIHQAQRLSRPVTIRQGRGSVIHARPAAAAGWSEVGGRVVAEPARLVEL
ncbi:PhzF family phenazine biosynthesis protein [Actinospica sp. MGRD01-02]|uniref:PhzF family phenazine biosynthesis protein n=1 Tax=Actinospica acidithermotolerans TaxID=2828514 RepID=A0A941EET1_9ACTN|nr:PhzF family phenazine biosynthesis protein [Actinospica acidithermotolerans]MBR7831365.1 PhzF family phenazine biosynthesis protein [Actinospica acidithermotolerans]